MADTAVAMDYSYTLTAAGVKSFGEGTLTVQDKSYVMQGNGLRVYCNASSMWVVDEAGKEIMIDNVSQETDSYLSNPALLLTNVYDVFSVSSPVANGETLTYTLSPKSDCGITSGVITLDVSGKTPVFVSGNFTTSDGVQLDVKIKSMTFMKKKPLTFYILDLSGFDSSWMMTDLR
jgi:outer membrane lipoprotein-sorting protein